MAARINADATIKGAVSASANVGVKTINATATVFRTASLSYYDGAYEFTPDTEEQTILIQGKTARLDITIKPIPSNYGLITYNGSTITVS